MGTSPIPRQTPPCRPETRDAQSGTFGQRDRRRPGLRSRGHGTSRRATVAIPAASTSHAIAISPTRMPWERGPPPPAGTVVLTEEKSGVPSRKCPMVVPVGRGAEIKPQLRCAFRSLRNRTAIPVGKKMAAWANGLNAEAGRGVSGLQRVPIACSGVEGDS